MRTVSTGLFTTAAAGLGAAAMALASHRFVPDQIRDDLREYSGLITGVSGTLFALTASLMIVSAWNSIGDAKQNVSKEARAAMDVYWFARGLPAQPRATIQALVRDYVGMVVNEEWRLMAAEHKLSESAWGRIMLWQVELAAIEPVTAGEITRYTHTLERNAVFVDARRIRQGQVMSSIPKPLWFALVVAGLFGLFLPVLVGAPNPLVHAVLAAAAAVIATFVLVLIAQLEHPFSGAVRVEPTLFKRLLVDFDVIDVVPVEPLPPHERVDERYQSFMDAAWARVAANPAVQAGEILKLTVPE